MFYDCNRLKEIELSNFNIINVEDFSYSFYKSRFATSLDISNFDAKNRNNMSFMSYYYKD